MSLIRRSLLNLLCTILLANAAILEVPDTAFDKSADGLKPFNFPAFADSVQPTAAAEEIKPADGFFANTDSNNDNQLSFDEFLRSDPYYARLKLEEFSRLDTNHDGVISQLEFDAQNEPQSQKAIDQQADYFVKIFQDHDTNFDLKLDIDELRDTLAALFWVKPKSDAKFREIFSQFDTDGDGGLNLNEYTNLDAKLQFEEFTSLSASEIEDQKAREEQHKKSATDCEDSDTTATTIEAPVATEIQEKVVAGVATTVAEETPTVGEATTVTEATTDEAP